MTIGEFNDSFVPLMDGVGLVARNYARWLNEKYGKAYAITVKFPHYDGDKDEPMEVLRCPSLPVPGMPPYRAGIPGIAFGFKKKLFSIPFDIVHSHSPFVTGNLALKISRKRHIPIVTTFHSKYKDDFKKALPFEWMRKIAMNKILKYYRAVDHVWVPNKATIDTLHGYGFEGKIDVMYNGTDITIPDNIEDYKRRGQEKMGAKDDDFVFLFIGQHRWEKNLKLMIEALKIVMDKRKHFKMVFVGQGYAENDMKQMVKDRKMDNYVNFLGVIRDREVIKTFYARTDLFLFPSLYDTSPLTLREAAAFHTPVVLAKNSSATEGIIDGKNGLIAENTPEGYAAKLIEVIDHPQIIEKVGQGAFDSLYRTWEQVSDEVNERYKDIIAEYKANHK